MAARPLILHVLEAVRGGTSRHVVDLVGSTPQLDHHVAVPAARRAPSSGAPVDQDGLERIRSGGATVHVVDMRRTPVHPANASAVVALRSLTGRLGADVVHGHSAVGGALARLAAAGTRVPVVYTPNGLPEGRAAVAVERLLGPLTTKLVAVSASEADLAHRLRLVRAGRSCVIPNGIAAAPAPGVSVDLRSVLHLDARTPLVGTVARLVPQKSPVDFVATCASVAALRRDVHVLLVGMGPLQASVDAAVDAAGIRDRFHQIEHLPGVSGVLDQLSVFTLPSRFEGGPYTPLEAMRAGVPVVLSDVVGNRDAVIDGVTGLLCAHGDIAGLSAAVVALLDDPARRRALTTAATARLQAEFDIEVMGRRLVALYGELISSASRRSTRRLPRPAATSSDHSPEHRAAV